MFTFIKIWSNVYEGEAANGVVEGQEEASTAEVSTEAGTAEVKGKEKVKTFTQDELNRIVEGEKKKFTQNREKLLSELKTLRETANLTQEQKDQLEARIDQVQNETLTAQELAKKEKEKLTKDYTSELTKEKNKTNYWQTKYTTERIERELLDAGAEAEAISNPQIADLLRNKTKLVEELKDGKPTGELLAKVTVREVKEDGSVIILDLSPAEALKRMKDEPQHWNLFKNNVNGGLGGFNTPNQSSLRGKEPPKDMAQYQKWRVDNNIAKQRNK